LVESGIGFSTKKREGKSDLKGKEKGRRSPDKCLKKGHPLLLVRGGEKKR